MVLLFRTLLEQELASRIEHKHRKRAMQGAGSVRRHLAGSADLPIALVNEDNVVVRICAVNHGNVSLRDPSLALRSFAQDSPCSVQDDRVCAANEILHCVQDDRAGAASAVTFISSSREPFHSLTDTAKHASTRSPGAS